MREGHQKPGCQWSPSSGGLTRNLDRWGQNPWDPGGGCRLSTLWGEHPHRSGSPKRSVPSSWLLSICTFCLGGGPLIQLGASLHPPTPHPPCFRSPWPLRYGGSSAGNVLPLPICSRRGGGPLPSAAALIPRRIRLQRRPFLQGSLQFLDSALKILNFPGNHLPSLWALPLGQWLSHHALGFGDSPCLECWKKCIWSTASGAYIPASLSSAL